MFIFSFAGVHGSINPEVIGESITVRVFFLSGETTALAVWNKEGKLTSVDGVAKADGDKVVLQYDGLKLRLGLETDEITGRLTTEFYRRHLFGWRKIGEISEFVSLFD